MNSFRRIYDFLFRFHTFLKKEDPEHHGFEIDFDFYYGHFGLSIQNCGSFLNEKSPYYLKDVEFDIGGLSDSQIENLLRTSLKQSLIKNNKTSYINKILSLLYDFQNTTEWPTHLIIEYVPNYAKRFFKVYLGDGFDEERDCVLSLDLAKYDNKRLFETIEKRLKLIKLDCEIYDIVQNLDVKNWQSFSSQKNTKQHKDLQKLYKVLDKRYKKKESLPLEGSRLFK